jgi:hypothetical protein
LLILTKGALFENGNCLTKGQVLELSILIPLKPILHSRIYPLNDTSLVDQVL